MFHYRCFRWKGAAPVAPVAPLPFVRRSACLICAGLGLTAFDPVPASAAPDPRPERGTWHWTGRGDNHPYGSARAVGNPESEAEILEIYRRWNIVRVYTSYPADRLENEPDPVARWNATLHGDGRNAFLLLSTTRWIFEDQRDALREALRKRLLDFNRSRTDPAERFHGLHFDIEPHILDEWNRATPEGKRDFLFLLRDLFLDARRYLDENGGAALPIHAALPVWFDRLPPELGGRGSIGWESPRQRDGWFRSVGDAVAAISLMAFETPHVRTILGNTEWERAHFAGDVFVALRANLGGEWKDISEMIAAMGEVEAATGGGIDIQPFRRFAEKAGNHPPPVTK